MMSPSPDSQRWFTSNSLAISRSASPARYSDAVFVRNWNKISLFANCPSRNKVFYNAKSAKVKRQS
jgi:hypothetical protein